MCAQPFGWLLKSSVNSFPLLMLGEINSARKQDRHDEVADLRSIDLAGDDCAAGHAGER